MNNLKQNNPLARRSSKHLNQSPKKPQNGSGSSRTGAESPRLPVKRISVQYAHVSVSRLLQQHKIRYIRKTHGKGVVRICSRTVTQLQHTAIIVAKIIDENLIEEIGMPLDYAYKMKSLVLFIKPVDKDATRKIEKKFRNSGLKFHITVFDVKNPYVQKKAVPDGPNEFQNNCKEVIDTQASVQKKQPKELSLENPQLIGKQVPREIVAKVNGIPAASMRKPKPNNFMQLLRILVFTTILFLLFYSTTMTTVQN
jgi:hypothetical protein